MTEMRQSLDECHNYSINSQRVASIPHGVHREEGGSLTTFQKEVSTFTMRTESLCTWGVQIK